MTFFFDRCVSKKVVGALRCLGEDVIHLDEVFGDNVKVADQKWITYCKLMGWIAVTCDSWIHKNAPELEALREANIVSVFIAEAWNDLPRWDKAVWVIKNWPRMKKEAEHEKPGAIIHVAVQGQIDILEGGKWGNARLKQPRARRSKS